MFSRVWDVLTKFYDRVLRPFVTWSWSNILKLHAWLRDTFGPILKFLDELRRDVLQIYDKWLRPIFAAIDAVRATLRLLADFHVPFAQAIDDKLAALEERLLRPIRLALSKLNEVIYWIDRIVDLNGLFERLTLVASAWKYERDLWANWWGSMHRRELEKPTSAATWPPARTTQQVARVMTDYFAGNDSPEKAHIDELAQDLVLELGRAGPLGL